MNIDTCVRKLLLCTFIHLQIDLNSFKALNFYLYIYIYVFGNIVYSNTTTFQGLSLPETNGYILKSRVTDEPTNIFSNKGNVGLVAEDIAAIRIQTAFRGFKVYDIQQLWFQNIYMSRKNCNI